MGWIYALFEEFIPSKFYTNPEQVKKDVKLPMYIPGCLIDEARNTNFNPDVVIDQLMEISKEIPVERTKPVCAIVKGMGGGKTRAFEEIRSRLMVREKVLVIGITFNIEWSYENCLDDWSKVATKDPKLSCVISVISRMAYVLFDKSFRETVALIKKKIDSLPDYYRTNPDVLLRIDYVD